MIYNLLTTNEENLRIIINEMVTKNQSKLCLNITGIKKKIIPELTGMIFNNNFKYLLQQTYVQLCFYFMLSVYTLSACR